MPGTISRMAAPILAPLAQMGEASEVTKWVFVLESNASAPTKSDIFLQHDARIRSIILVEI